MPRLSAQDRKDIVYLTGCALSGILADHTHVNQVPMHNCGQSCAEWAARLGFEAFRRAKVKMNAYHRGEKDHYFGIEDHDRLYPSPR